MISALIRVESSRNLGKSAFFQVKKSNTWIYEPKRHKPYSLLEKKGICSPVKWGILMLKKFQAKGLLKDCKEITLYIAIDLLEDEKAASEFMSLLRIPAKYIQELSRYKCNLEIYVG